MSIAAVPNDVRMPDMSQVALVDEVGVKERAARFQTRSIKKESKIEALHMVLSMIDLTTLEGMDTPGKVKQLCQKAIHLHDAVPDLPHVAAVCVYPTMVGVAKKGIRRSQHQRRICCDRISKRYGTTTNQIRRNPNCS